MLGDYIEVVNVACLTSISLASATNSDICDVSVHSEVRSVCILVTCFVQPRAAEEMLKKVNVFSDMWKNGKISYPVKAAMARLATGLQLAYSESL